MLSGIYEGHEILMEIDAKGGSIVFSIGDKYTSPVHNYSNHIMMSAGLRDILSYDGCVKFLDDNNVPRNHPLWHLNHDGPPKY